MTPKTFTRYFTIFAWCVLAAVIVTIAVWAYMVKQSLNGKAEWAAFSHAHSTFKSIPIQRPEIHDLKGEKYLVCPHVGENVVIMLHPKYSPFFKQRPYTSAFEIGPEDLITARNSGMSDTVSEALHCKASKPRY